jgi:hypothetical protein
MSDRLTEEEAERIKRCAREFVESSIQLMGELTDVSDSDFRFNEIMQIYWFEILHNWDISEETIAKVIYLLRYEGEQS